MYTKFGINNHGRDILREMHAQKSDISIHWVWLVIALLVIASIQIG